MAPISVALGAECSFVARSVDIDRDLPGVIERAAKHHGTAFCEIYQDCNIFNHKAFEYATDKDTKEEHVLRLEHGKPLIFGKNRDKGIRLHGTRPEVVTLGNGVAPDDLVVHDENDLTHAFMLSRLKQPEFPEPVGVFYVRQDDCYEELLAKQTADAIAARGKGTLEELFNEGEVYEIQ